MCNVIISAGFLAISTYLPVFEGTSVKIAKGQIKGVAIFCICDTMASLLSFAAVEFVPLSVLASIMCGAMMVCGVILSRLVLKELIEWLQILAAIICLIGLVASATGSYTSLKKGHINKEFNTSASTVVIGNLSDITEFSSSSYFFTTVGDTTSISYLSKALDTSKTQRNINTTDLHELVIGLLLSCFAGFGAATAMVALKSVQDDLDNIHVLTFWFTLTGTIASAIGSGLIEHSELSFPSDLNNGLYLLAHLGTSTCALVFYIIARKKLSAHITSIVYSSQIPVNVFLQYTLFKHLQPMDGGLLEIVGAGIVTVGLVIPPVMSLIKLKNSEYQTIDTLKE